MQLMTGAFNNGEKIPRRYTGDGDDLSPPLTWSGIPQTAADLALICDDPDAPGDEPFVHWVACHMPIDQLLPEGIPRRPHPEVLAGLAQGSNSYGRIGYSGPTPPIGHGVHHYRFRLYALDRRLDLRDGFDKAKLLNAMDGNILDQAELTGTYER